jgi:hypothetical protein
MPAQSRRRWHKYLHNQFRILIMYFFKGMFLFCSRWRRVKLLYVVTRYTPFLLFAAHLYSTSWAWIDLIYHVDKLIPVNFAPDDISDVCGLAMDKSSAYLMVNLDMSICQQHLLMCIKLYVGILSYWPLFSPTGLSVILFVCSECNFSIISIASTKLWFLQLSSYSGRTCYGITIRSFWQQCYWLL